VDLSSEMPPIGDQGGQGSCVSWSMGYYHRTQLEYRERHWDLTDPHHQFSPAFIYNQVNGGADQGSYFEHSARLVCDEGCAPMADMPYNQNDFLSWPSESAYSHAIPLRTRTWSWMNVRDTAELGNVKQLLANGSTVVLGINCYQNFMNIEQFHNTYCVADRYGPNTFGHGVCAVGYDDSLSTHDGKGALKLVNSFGTGWGASGYWWMSYQAVMDAGLSQRYAVFLTDTVGYQPQLLARVRVEHPTRDRVALQFLAGPAGSPLWQDTFRSAHMTVTDQSFPDHNLVFDLTAAAPYITGGQTDSIYFVTRDLSGDGETGAVRYFSVQYLPWGNLYPSADTPLAIPDGGTWVYAGARIRRENYDAGPMRVVVPAGVLTADSTYTPQVMIRNFGLSTASFPVRLSIGAGYADSSNVSSLAPGDSAIVQFLSWTSPGQGAVPVRCTTALSGDEFHDNDVVSETARVYYRDIALVGFASPPDTVDSGQSVLPQARVRNNSTQEETFLMYFRIPDESYNHWTMARTLPPGRETVLTFTPWSPNSQGDHAYNGLLVAGDMDPSNDAICNLTLSSLTSAAAASCRLPPAQMMCRISRRESTSSERQSPIVSCRRRRSSSVGDIHHGCPAPALRRPGRLVAAAFQPGRLRDGSRVLLAVHHRSEPDSGPDHAGARLGWRQQRVPPESQLRNDAGRPVPGNAPRKPVAQSRVRTHPRRHARRQIEQPVRRRVCPRRRRLHAHGRGPDPGHGNRVDSLEAGRCGALLSRPRDRDIQAEHVPRRARPHAAQPPLP
jgi:hypothetical protein